MKQFMMWLVIVSSSLTVAACGSSLFHREKSDSDTPTPTPQTQSSNSSKTGPSNQTTSSQTQPTPTPSSDVVTSSDQNGLIGKSLVFDQDLTTSNSQLTAISSGSYSYLSLKLDQFCSMMLYDAILDSSGTTTVVTKNSTFKVVTSANLGDTTSGNYTLAAQAPSGAKPSAIQISCRKVMAVDELKTLLVGSHGSFK